MRHSIRSDTPSDHLAPKRMPRAVREQARAGGEQRPERAVLVSILLPATTADLRNPLGELAALAEAAGVQVVDTMTQKRMNLTPGYALGKGKIEELAQRAEDAQADVVIFDNDLAPRQIRGLEEEIQRKVIDRSELILDIFAARARTREAQLQVELAQLQYTAPRLRGMWTHLERIAGGGGGTAAGAVGGVGTRGPGERQIEVDRRVVKDRITHLRRELEEVLHRKEREVRARSDQYTVSLVGYTNAGKSTLMNRLTNAGQFVADMLFATLDTKTVRWNLGEGRSVLLSDTVGFVRDLPHHLVASFRATLEEALHAHLLLHIVDASSPQAWRQLDAVEQVLTDLGADDIPRLTLLNKIDIANDAAVADILVRKSIDALPISAVTGEGIDKLVTTVLRRSEGDSLMLQVRIPQGDGKLLTELTKVAEVIDRQYDEEAVTLKLRVNKSQLRQLMGRYPVLVQQNPQLQDVEA